MDGTQTSEDKTGGKKPDERHMRREGFKQVEPDWSKLSMRGKTLKDGNVEWEREDPELRIMEKYGLRAEELPRTQAFIDRCTAAALALCVPIADDRIAVCAQVPAEVTA